MSYYRKRRRSGGTYHNNKSTGQLIVGILAVFLLVPLILSLIPVNSGSDAGATEPTVAPTVPIETVDASIVNWELFGEYLTSRVSAAGVSGEYGPHLSYDDSYSSNWNPQLKSFTEDTGIIYSLDNAYDLTAAQLIFNNCNTYFKLYGSSDGEEYVELANVNKDNVSDYYLSNKIATVPLSHSDIRYVKVIFTGTAIDGLLWVALSNCSFIGALS